MLYYVNTSGAKTAAGDLLEGLVPSDAVVVLHELGITQSTEFGDAQSEQITISLKRAVGSTSGSGGSALTPRLQESGQAAAGGTYEGMNTTALSGGTITTLLQESFNVMNGYTKIWTPETRPRFSPGQFFVVTLDSTPNDSITFQVYAAFEEIGG